MTTRLDLLGMTGLAPRRTISPRRLSPSLIPFVSEERAHGRRERQNIGRRRDIGILASGQMQDDRPAERIAQRMDFCRAASARAADCLIVLPPSAGATPVFFNRRRGRATARRHFRRTWPALRRCAPSPVLDPAVEAIVDGRVRAVFTQAVAASGTRLRHVNDSAANAPVVVPIRPVSPLGR